MGAIRVLAFARYGALLVQRQPDGEARTLIGAIAVRADRASVQLHQSFHHRQPQPHSAATLAQAALGLGEGLKQPLERVWVDAQPCVSDLQHGAIRGPREHH